MIRGFAFVAFLFIIKIAVFGQTSGQIVDENANPIGLANVALLSSSDSSLVCGGVTNEQGFFKLEKSFLPGMHLLRVSYLGYKTTLLRQFTDGGKITLVGSNNMLGEVAVVSQKRIFKSRGTDIIADIQHSPFKDFGTADDILGKIPMVSGSNGSYSVFGRENTAIYINRRKVTDMAELGRIQSKDIATIEVINNPGVGYDGDIHAVIKINLKRNTDKGLGVMTSVKDSQGRRNSDNEQVQLTYNTSITNSFLSFANNSSRYSTDQTNVEQFKTATDEWSLTNDMPRWQSNYYSYNIAGGTSLYLPNGGMLGGQLAYTKETDRYGGKSIAEMLKNETLFEKLSSDIRSFSNYHQWLGNIYYESKLSSKLSFDFNGDFLYRKASDSRANVEEGGLTSIHTINTNNWMSHHIYAGRFNFKYAINSKLSFTLGGDASYVSDDKNNQGLDGDDETCKYALHSDENKYAVFIQSDFNIGKLGSQVGVRYEVFKLKYEDRISGDNLADKFYHRFYPFFSLSMPIQSVKMGLSLSTKVSRPSYYQLRNSREYLNRYEIEAGNPMLLPQYTTDITYSLQYQNLRLGVDYQWIKDYIMMNNLVTQQSPLIALSQPFSKPHYSAFSANVSYSKTIGIWEAYLTTSMMRTFLDIYDSAGNRMNGRKPYFKAYMENYFNLKHSWMPYILLSYNSTGDLKEYNIREAFNLDFGITKHLFDNKLFLRLSVTNALGTKEKETRYAPDFVYYKNRFRDNRNITLYVRYTFNNKKKYQGKSSANEEINRL